MIFKTLQATLIVFPRYHRWLELLNNQMISNQYCEYISLHITQTALYTAAILNDFPSSQPYLPHFSPSTFCFLYWLCINFPENYHLQLWIFEFNVCFM